MVQCRIYYHQTNNKQDNIWTITKDKLTATVWRINKTKRTIHQPTVPSAINIGTYKASNYAGLQHIKQSTLTKRRTGQDGKHIWHNAGYGSQQNTYFPLVRLNNTQLSSSWLPVLHKWLTKFYTALPLNLTKSVVSLLHQHEPPGQAILIIRYSVWDNLQG
jgi:hypothetical protein